MDAATQLDNRDELFAGRMFDFRGYNQSMSEQKIKDTYEWGQHLLGLSTSASFPPTP